MDCCFYVPTQLIAAYQTRAAFATAYVYAVDSSTSTVPWELFAFGNATINALDHVSNSHAKLTVGNIWADKCEIRHMCDSSPNGVVEKSRCRVCVCLYACMQQRRGDGYAYTWNITIQPTTFVNYTQGGSTTTLPTTIKLF